MTATHGMHPRAPTSTQRLILRDSFSQRVRDTLARRVGYRCSRPQCSRITSGPHSEPERAVSIGVAAHVTAAAPGGPRYDEAHTSEERSSILNAIWLCQSCSKLIDSDVQRYSVAVLFAWKQRAETNADEALVGIPWSEFFPQAPRAKHVPIPRIDGQTYDVARELLVKAGWQPRMNHWTQADSFDMQYGNGLHFWLKGYHEIRHASGTGLAFCSFGFEDVYGHKLVVVTAGEVLEDQSNTACVWRWYFEETPEAE